MSAAFVGREATAAAEATLETHLPVIALEHKQKICAFNVIHNLKGDLNRNLEKMRFNT